MNSKNILLCLLLVATAVFHPAKAQVIINEVCSYNGGLILDENGNESDWIEFYNAGSTPADLHNYYLISADRTEWYFPQITLLPQQFLLVFASGEDRTEPLLHSNFKLSKDGETLTLFTASGAVADIMILPKLHLNHSAGSTTDGSQLKGIFKDPTPGTSNQNASVFTGYVSKPIFSKPPGFYNGPCILELTGTPGGIIHFTTDGSKPDELSPVYASPFVLAATTVLRAITISNVSIELPSEIVTNSYFINYETTLPLFSISTAPANLWDWNTGIYVSGPNASPNYPYYGANFWQDWEILAQIEFYDENGERQINQQAGVKINGGSSNRSKPMKSLRLTNKSEYGTTGFKYSFFEEKAIDDFKIIVLRNSSGDFNKTHFRDGSLHKLMIGKTDIDLSAYKPSAVFLNGIYHGVHNIREKISKHYLAENYGIDVDNIDLLEEDSLVIEGDFSAFNSMHTFITTNDMSDQDKFSVAAELIDTRSLCDYYIAETFLSNIDWPYNNLKLWRVKEPVSKFRYILIDLDIALGNNGWAPADYDILGRIMGTYGDNNRHVQIFRSLLKNNAFREYYINRYADLVNTLFSSQNMEDHINKVRNVLYPEMPLHFNKWGNDMAGWDNEIYNVVMPHIYDRPAFAMEQVRQVFDLYGIVSVELDVWPADAGAIHINTITPGPLPWKGNYFNGNPVTITVEPKPGFTFVKWVSDKIAITDAASKMLQINPVTDNRFTAFFSSSSGDDALMIYPNPVKENLHLGCVFDNNSKGRIEIKDAPGKTVLYQDNLELHNGINELDVDIHKLTPGAYMLFLTSEEGTKTAKFMVL